MIKFIRFGCSFNLYSELEFEIQSGQNPFKLLNFVFNNKLLLARVTKIRKNYYSTEIKTPKPNKMPRIVNECKMTEYFVRL
ncbi:hypothetical protein EGI31_02890 [Lacihabitans soyangensis]|uniref:Uncharacterized protein n=1 Tax=Lacihabitans soyangensis TaxID=869394 RepID=A0AAE3KR54_9BACT|nr:hypothetical protein [Lacihabitans soyangensis]